MRAPPRPAGISFFVIFFFWFFRDRVFCFEFLKSARFSASVCPPVLVLPASCFLFLTRDQARDCIRTRRTIPASMCLAVPGFLSVSLSPPFSILLPLSSTRGLSPSPWPVQLGSLSSLCPPVCLPSLPHGDESGTRIPARALDEMCGFLSGVPGQAASQVCVPCSRCACRSVGR